MAAGGRGRAAASPVFRPGNCPQHARRIAVAGWMGQATSSPVFRMGDRPQHARRIAVAAGGWGRPPVKGRCGRASFGLPVKGQSAERPGRTRRRSPKRLHCAAHRRQPRSPAEHFTHTRT